MPDNDIRISRKTFGLVFLFINLYPAYLALNAMRWVPELRELIGEMLGPEHIPAVSQCLLTFHPFLWVLPTLSIVLVIITMMNQGDNQALYAASIIATLVVTVIVHGLTSQGALAPIELIIQRMGM